MQTSSEQQSVQRVITRTHGLAVIDCAISPCGQRAHCTVITDKKSHTKLYHEVKSDTASHKMSYKYSGNFVVASLRIIC